MTKTENPQELNLTPFQIQQLSKAHRRVTRAAFDLEMIQWGDSKTPEDREAVREEVASAARGWEVALYGEEATARLDAYSALRSAQREAEKN